MLKKVLKRAIRKARTTLRGRENGRDPAEWRDDRHPYAYPYLNARLLELMTKGKGVLRPHYTWGILHAAHLARALGVERISAIEFGVAGGNGLYALERASEWVGQILGVGIEVYGFDMGSGLPKPTDYRDLPNLYTEGDYPMDTALLRKHLEKAELILGPVKQTVPAFLERSPAPVGFVSIDLDYYSSTIEAFQVFEADYDLLLPRVHCYFDDILGFTCSEFTGERLAIAEFNDTHEMRKISPIFGLRYWVPKKYRDAMWVEQFYLAHFFQHPLYGEPDGLVQPGGERSTDFAVREEATALHADASVGAR